MMRGGGLATDTTTSRCLPPSVILDQRGILTFRNVWRVLAMCDCTLMRSGASLTTPRLASVPDGCKLRRSAPVNTTGRAAARAIDATKGQPPQHGHHAALPCCNRGSKSFIWTYLGHGFHVDVSRQGASRPIGHYCQPAGQCRARRFASVEPYRRQRLAAETLAVAQSSCCRR